VCPRARAFALALALERSFLKCLARTRRTRTPHTRQTQLLAKMMIFPWMVLHFSHFRKIRTFAKCYTQNVRRKMFFLQGSFSSSARESRKLRCPTSSWRTCPPMAPPLPVNDVPCRDGDVPCQVDCLPRRIDGVPRQVNRLAR
jgi:hypothetical protein